MSKKMLGLILLVVCAGAIVGVAQETPLAEPQTVQVAAADGLMLVGDFYFLATDTNLELPAVLLMHQNGSNRHSWQPLIPALLESGYHVLAVDLRGHGDTGGERDWQAAIGDVQTWLDWLRHEQRGVRDDGISIVGASIGSNLALVGCANDPACVTAIALSPGEDYFGVRPGEALTGRLADRPLLLVAAQDDRESADSVRRFVADAPGDIGARIYRQAGHGTGIFSSPERDSLIALIVAWLSEHRPE